MSGGVLGLIMEFQAPGFGLPGVVGISCLALYFFGKYIVNLAGWEEVMLFILGLLLLGLEIFIFPGYFIPGALGLILVFISMFMAGISPKIPFDLEWPSVQEQANSVAVSFIITVLGFGFIYYWMMKDPKRVPLVLTKELTKESGYTAPEDYSPLLNKTGVSVTDLHPSGKAKIEGETIEVVTNGDFIESGQEIEVVEVEGIRVVVQKRKNNG
jgi:membrane-bound serine protease (ClpP class)